MFATVGRTRAPNRRAVPFLLSLLLNGGSIGALALLGARQVEEYVEAEVGIERPYELVAPAPAGPPAGGAPAPKKRATRTRVETPAPTPLPPVVTDAVVTAVPDPADTTGDVVADAEPGGGGGGKGPGEGTGGGGEGTGGLGGGGDGVRVVHWSEVAVKTRAQVRPSDYPAAAAALNLPDSRCVVRILIDEKGVPNDVVVKTCPEVFRAAADSVARRYRFYPVVVEGNATRAAFDLTINFRRE